MWNFLERQKNVFINSLKQAKIEGILSISQRQAVQKVHRIWRPISLIDVDTKILSKAFTAKFKPFLLSIISSNQTASVEKRCISEIGRLISDIMDICVKKNFPGYLVILKKLLIPQIITFCYPFWKKFGFGDNFINWIKILSSDQHSCVTNGGFAT